MAIVSEWGIRTADEFHPAGEPVTLTDEEEASLVDAGLAKWAEVKGGKSLTEGKEHDKEDDDDEWPSAEAFAKMTAPAQKELLKEAGLDPATNAEDRLQQYTEFLASDEE